MWHTKTLQVGKVGIRWGEWYCSAIMLKINKTIDSHPTVISQSDLRTHYNGVIPVSQEKSTNTE